MTKDFWRNQAKEYKFDVKAVNFDPLEEELELYFLENLIGDEELIFDMGCGNGRTLLELAKKKKKSNFLGVDFVEEMIAIAQEQKKSLDVSNVDFYVADASSEKIKKMFPSKFDKVITKRLLINLKGENKFKAIENIHSVLKEKGTYIMIECFIEPLNRINQIRKGLNLEEIKVKSFNEYLRFEFLKEISDLFIIKNKTDFESQYYFISRIYNAYLSEGKPDYYAPINKLAVELTKMGVSGEGGYSPEIIFVLEKK